LYQQAEGLDAYVLADSQEALGINSQRDYWQVSNIMRMRMLEALARRGVKIIDPETTFIHEGVKVGKNTVIYPFTFIEKGVIIGSNCSLGPFVRLRKGTVIRDHAQIGNFLEVNRSRIGKAVKAKHFSYLGDVTLGDNVNIGAGTVVANYDGRSKHNTYIQKDAFIGSDTVLVAPVTVGKGASTGAGCVVTKNVKPNTVVAGVPARLLRKKAKNR
jgi:bifunctional UDP-N-acetylglucosamine pyrophosphorylase/glucosamine-1-phosphate N-acetyltransferase